MKEMTTFDFGTLQKTIWHVEIGGECGGDFSLARGRDGRLYEIIQTENFVRSIYDEDGFLIDDVYTSECNVFEVDDAEAMMFSRAYGKEKVFEKALNEGGQKNENS